MQRKTRKIVILISFFISYIIYLLWRLLYTIPVDYGILATIFGGLLITAEIVGFFESIMFYITLWDTRTPTTPDVNGKEYPDVDVFIATYNEPIELLYKTIIGCKNMDYPDKNKVHIYICDDGNRKEMSELCKKLQVGYITRKEHIHAKAGNLNNALKYSNSPYIITFDADMIPMHDFLLATIPFFMTGEKVGFVQVPQNFYNPDTFQYNLFSERQIPNEQNLFSRLIQAGKSRFNAIIYAGSNTVISRAALDEIGGFVVGTITEDFATGMIIQDRGYKSICLNEIHASGLSPDNLEDMYNQRIRWGRGVIQTFKRFNPLKRKALSIMQKIMYLSAASYWYFGIWRFIFFISPILYSVFGIVVLDADPLSILLIWTPMYLLTNYAFDIYTNNTRNTIWSHIYDTIMFPQVTMGVILETIGLKMLAFKVTPKDADIRNKFIHKYRLVWVQGILAILSAIGIVNLIIAAFTAFSFSHVINLFWLSYNLYLLTMAVLFSFERPKFRTAERMSIAIDALIDYDGKIAHGITNDISETGITIITEYPVKMEKGSIHIVKLINERYKAECKVKFIYGINNKYAFHIEEIDEENYKQLILIIYDRVPDGISDLSEANKLTLNRYIKSRKKLKI